VDPCSRYHPRTFMTCLVCSECPLSVPMLEMCYRRRGDGAERGSVVITRGEKEEVKCDNEVIMR